MRGVGRASAALTIVNALSTGVGAAVGLDLPAEAEVTLHPAGSHGKWDVRVEDRARTPLVIATLTEALRAFAPGSSGSGELSLRSEIPPARGLKSSSAVSVAIAGAVAEATDSNPSAADLARISARASVAAGVSATGAFDDALAGLSSGIVVTDNSQQELLRTISVDPAWAAALYIPELDHRPSPELWVAFRAEARAGQEAVDRLMAGDWTGAMRANSALVERLLRYDYAGLRADLEAHGAVCAGVSGLGPTLAAIVPRARAQDCLEIFPGPVHLRRLVALRTGNGPAGGGER